MLLETAWTRLHAAAGLSVSKGAEEADTMFRSFFASKQETDDCEPFEPEECLPLLPLEDSAS